MVLGIFTQVAMRAGFGDLAGKLTSQFVFERRDFIFQLLYKILHLEAFYIIGVENGSCEATGDLGGIFGCCNAGGYGD